MVFEWPYFGAKLMPLYMLMDDCSSYTCTHTHTSIHTHPHMHEYTPTTHMHTHICTCILVHPPTCTNTHHIHTHTQFTCTPPSTSIPMQCMNVHTPQTLIQMHAYTLNYAPSNFFFWSSGTNLFANKQNKRFHLFHIFRTPLPQSNNLRIWPII